MVVASADIDSNGPLYRNQRYQKPRGTFRKFRLIKAAPGTRQPHFTEISWQYSGSPGDRILILISPK